MISASLEGEQPKSKTSGVASQKWADVEGWEKESGTGLFSFDKPVLRLLFLKIMSCENSTEQGNNSLLGKKTTRAAVLQNYIFCYYYGLETYRNATEQEREYLNPLSLSLSLSPYIDMNLQHSIAVLDIINLWLLFISLLPTSYLI